MYLAPAAMLNLYKWSIDTHIIWSWPMLTFQCRESCELCLIFYNTASFPTNDVQLVLSVKRLTIRTLIHAHRVESTLFPSYSTGKEEVPLGQSFPLKSYFMKHFLVLYDFNHFRSIINRYLSYTICTFYFLLLRT